MRAITPDDPNVCVDLVRRGHLASPTLIHMHSPEYYKKGRIDFHMGTPPVPRYIVDTGSVRAPIDDTIHTIPSVLTMGIPHWLAISITGGFGVVLVLATELLLISQAALLVNPFFATGAVFLLASFLMPLLGYLLRRVR